jgi:fido (protein-threonine AMPylation protein)
MSATDNPYRHDNGTLKNLLCIQDAAKLREQEYQLTRFRMLELQDKPIEGAYDLAHLQTIHKHVFQDVYAWAGELRDINVSKKSLTEPGWKTVFADKAQITEQGAQAAALAKGLRSETLGAEEFAKGLTEVYAAWNAAHPFPEGNGRALNVMLQQLAKEQGHELDFRRMPGDFLLDAAEKSLERVNIDMPSRKRPADLSEMREVFEYMTDPKPEQQLPLQTIRINEYEQADRMLVQASVSAAVKADPQWFIDEYKRHPESHDGRYVCADLFKETFAEYAASAESRNRYNGPVHNSAAVLAAELFRQNLSEGHGDRDTVLFLTGTPGAGKTTTVLQNNSLPSNVAMVYEGQLANPAQAIEKIQQVLDAGLRPAITVVHALPEKALDNTLQRFEVVGRGASTRVMSEIQGKLPDALREIRTQYGDAVQFAVVDARTPARPVVTGWEHMEVLRSEGNHERIKATLDAALEQHRARQAVSEAGYRQAAGLAPVHPYLDLAANSTKIHPANGKQSAGQATEQRANILKQERSHHERSR